MLLHPEDAWVELWMPRLDDEPLDVRATARDAGNLWHGVLSAFGADIDVHDGPVLHPEQGAIACFAAIGPGELTVQGSKLVGVSQWRVREGTLVSMVLAARPPRELATYLARHGSDVPELDRATSLADLDEGASAGELAEAFVLEVASRLPAVLRAPELFG